jgi:hypothetical protein
MGDGTRAVLFAVGQILSLLFFVLTAGVWCYALYDGIKSRANPARAKTYWQRFLMAFVLFTGLGAIASALAAFSSSLYP